MPLHNLRRLMFVMDTQCFCEVGIRFSSTYSPKSMLQIGFGIAQSVQYPSYGQDGRVVVLDFRKDASINSKSLYVFLSSAAFRRTLRKPICVKGSWGSFGVGKGAGGVKLITYPQLVLRLTLIVLMSRIE